MMLWHTYVPESQRGKGIAEIIVEEAMEWASANSLSVDSSCSYVNETFMKRPHNRQRWKHIMIRDY
jgi:predicted GNAT family acetyltransferase